MPWANRKLPKDYNGPWAGECTCEADGTIEVGEECECDLVLPPKPEVKDPVRDSLRAKINDALEGLKLTKKEQAILDKVRVVID